MKQLGFAPIYIILGIIVVLVALGGAYYFGKLIVKPVDNNSKACTMEAKICPDGSAVGRAGPNCEFSACTTITPTEIPNETTNWKFLIMPTITNQPILTPQPTCRPCAQYSPPSEDFCKDGKYIPPKQDKCGCWGPPGCQR